MSSSALSAAMFVCTENEMSTASANAAATNANSHLRKALRIPSSPSANPSAYPLNRVPEAAKGNRR